MRLPLFAKKQDYIAFEGVPAESLARPDAPELLTSCPMSNQWHLLVQAAEPSNLSTRMQSASVTHTHCWQAHAKGRQNRPDTSYLVTRFTSFHVSTTPGNFGLRAVQTLCQKNS
jgi:hypothetical protein